MVRRWGMSERVGLVYYQDQEALKNASDSQRAVLDDEVKKLLQVSTPHSSVCARASAAYVVKSL